MIADTTVPIFATSSPRLETAPPRGLGSVALVAPGNDFVCDAQQLCAGFAAS
jgi:hypothetical protein